MNKVFLGINVSHGASASLMINGEIKFVYQEERFNGIKNFVGYPKKSIDKCIDYIKKNKLTIDNAAFSTINNHIFSFKYPLDHYYTIDDWLDYYLNNFFTENNKIKNVIKRVNENKKKKYIDLYLRFSNVKKKNYFNNFKLLRTLQINLLKKQSKGLIHKITFIDHHTCHAYYATYASKIKENKAAILTIDSEGDGLNQTFWIYDKKKNNLKKINQSSECDLARVYRFITLILKMKPNEHEYKVMGLAPYAKDEYSTQAYEEIFKDILTVKNCKVVHKKRPKNLFRYLYDKTRKYRFDNIAGASQIFVEKISSMLTQQIHKKYKINSFSLSGGVSMNIKMNKHLSSQSFVKNFYVPPTGTDDSLSIGACYYLNKSNQNNKYLENIYLGQPLANEKILKKDILSILKDKKKYLIKENINQKHVAKLLKNGEIIAVARGREEFGARALGNRSILANPFTEGVVKKINEQIKNRDFWMPFALTILDEKHKSFILNKKSIESDFMTIGFDTLKKNYYKIKNGTHPYDKTVRPQILKKKFNSKYHSLINEFYKISDVPALLNTSLNLHGRPISSKLNDVIFTFKNSGLKYLYLEDKYLITKL